MIHRETYRPSRPLSTWLFVMSLCLSMAGLVGLSVKAIRTAANNDYRASALETDDLVVNNTSTMTGHSSVKLLQTPIAQEGQLTFQTRLDNWSPADIATSSVLEVLASDNVGTLITGINATGMVLGDVRYICNANGPVDDGVVALSNEDTNSTASNRIWTPDSGHASISQVTISRFIIGPTECVPLVYMAPDQTNQSQTRWVVVSGGTRKTRSTMGSLQLFPPLQPDPNLVTGTLNNWNPVDICPQVSGAHGGSCEAGSSTKFSDYSLIYVTTKDGTGATITGMLTNGRGDPSAQGPIKVILNKGPGSLTLKSQSGSSTSGNQFNLPSNTDVIIGVGQSRMFWSDYIFWYPVGTTFAYSGSTNSLQCMTAANSLGNCLAGETDDGTTLTLVPAKVTITESTGLVALTGKVTSNLTIDGDPLAITDSATARTTSVVHDINIVDNGSFNTTAGAISIFGIASTVTDSKSAGANPLTCYGGDFAASGCDVNHALVTGPGDVVLGSTVTVSGSNTFEVGGQSFHDSKSTFSAHIQTSATALTSSNLSSCGTTPSIATGSTDVAGTITEGTTATGCTLTFAATYTNSPFCVCSGEVSGQTAGVLVGCHTTATTLVIENASASNNVIEYHCLGRAGGA